MPAASSTPSMPAPRRRWHRLLALACAAWLAACGDGYIVIGHFVWGDREDENDPNLVVVVTKHTLDAQHQSVHAETVQRPVASASAPVRDELARLQATDAGQCQPGTVAYELVMNGPAGPQRYRTADWACDGGQPELSGYIEAEDLAHFATVMSRESRT